MFREYLKEKYNLTDEQMDRAEWMLEVDKARVEDIIVRLDIQASASFILDFQVYASECLSGTVYGLH